MTRPKLAFGLVLVTLLSAPAPALAHGIGGRPDLPVPFSVFVIGAGVAVVISFVVLALGWQTPRLQTIDTSVGRSGAGRWRTVAAAVGVVAWALVVITGFAAVQDTGLSAVLVWVYFWLVVPFASAVAGDVWRWLNPFRTIAALVNSDVDERPELAARLGVYPAVALFVSFAWLALVASTSTGPRTLALAAIVYTMVLVGATKVFGVETGLRAFDAFSLYNSLFARIAAIDLDPEPAAVGTATTEGPTATIARRGWLRALPQTPRHPGLALFVVAMIGTVTYDGLSGTEFFATQFDRSLRREVWFGTLALIITVGLVGAGYWAASAAAARLARSDRTGRDVARSFAHTLVPIALVYAVAHYFTLVLFEGQILLSAISDPFGRGWDLFGTADRSISVFLGPSTIWYVQVGAIMLGHVAGVVLAHDRALAEFGPRRAMRARYAMLALMVASTSLGLFVVSGG